MPFGVAAAIWGEQPAADQWCALCSAFVGRTFLGVGDVPLCYCHDPAIVPKKLVQPCLALHGYIDCLTSLGGNAHYHSPGVELVEAPAPQGRSVGECQDPLHVILGCHGCW
jgi:hypothetical protein